MSRLAQNAPQSAMTIADFVKYNFVPEHVAMKTLSGRTHYRDPEAGAHAGRS
jgi:hypothetical protein